MFLCRRPFCPTKDRSRSPGFQRECLHSAHDDLSLFVLCFSLLCNRFAHLFHPPSLSIYSTHTHLIAEGVHPFHFAYTQRCRLQNYIPSTAPPVHPVHPPAPAGPTVASKLDYFSKIPLHLPSLFLSNSLALSLPPCLQLIKPLLPSRSY